MQDPAGVEVVTFQVRQEAEGGFSARAKVGTYSMITQGDDLDELHRMIQDLIEDYNANESGQIEDYALLFSKPKSIAA
jgi:hypothetical protein